MSGTRIGGLKTASTILARNPNHYSDIGRKGGANGHTGGFAANPGLARIAGAKGGRISRRGPVQKDFFNVDSTILPEKKKSIFDQIKSLFRRSNK